MALSTGSASARACRTDCRAADTVFLPEGEKDVATLEDWGLAASCDPGGSGGSHLYGGWLDHFRHRHIVILPDNDAPGRKHAGAITEHLLPIAATLRIVELPGLPAKGDVTDWKEAGARSSSFVCWFLKLRRWTPRG